jgi:hypothetical protein
MTTETVPTVARKGKVARLPADIRRELNVRLANGESGPTLLKWLNALPETKRLLAAEYDNEPISASNLSQWRQGGYQEYLAAQQSVDKIRTLAQFSMDLARASGGNLAEGPQAIAAGRLLEMIEGASEENLGKLVQAITSIRATELDSKKLSLAENKLAQDERSIGLQEAKFQRETAALFLQWFDNKRAVEIAESNAGKPVKMDHLVKLFFGERPKANP